MKHLFSLLLIVMSGVSTIEVLESDTTDQYVMSITALTLSLTCMVVNIISPLFNSKN
jgi:hypothetical protein